MLSNSTIMLDPSSITVTGGTSQTFLITKNTGSQLSLGCSTDTDSRLRKTIEAKTSISQPSARGANGYTQSRSSMDVVFPKSLANGVITKNAGGIYFRFDPETTAAEKLRYRQMLAQLLIDSDYSDFWDNQATV